MKPATSTATPEARSPQALPAFCICIFLALAVLAVFWQTAHFEFVNYDDEKNVYENPVVQKGLSLNAVGWAFTHLQVANWIPLTTLSHILDCQLFGLHAGGHHLVNVFWHAASAVLLFLVSRRMTGALWRSAFVAAVFAVHPLRAESVAWVSERKDVLSAFFFMLTIGAYVRFVEKQKASASAKATADKTADRESRDWNNRTNCAIRRGRRFYYTLALVFFALGLLAKSMVATLPFVLLLLDYWPLGRMRGMENLEFRMQNGESRKQKPVRGEAGSEGVPFWGLVREKIPFFALGAGVCVATALAPGLVVRNTHAAPLPERAANALVSCAVYLRQMVFPANLATPYPNPPNGQPPWEVCLAFAVLAAISAAVVVCRKKRPWLLMGWLWYLGMVFPVIGIIQISPDTAHADRYTYLPQIGLALAGTWAVAEWGAGWKYRREIFGALMIAVVGALMVCAHRQTSYWQDPESLWTRALARTSNNSVAHNNIGHALFQKGKLEEAVGHYKQALEINTNYAQAHYNLGVVCLKQNDTDGAIAEFIRAMRVRPDYMEAHFDLGTALALKGDLDEAILEYKTALEIEPDFVQANYNLGKALLLKGDVDPAMSCLSKTIPVSQDPLANWYNFGNGFLQEPDPSCAIVCYRQAIKINPRFADAYANLGVALSQKGETKEALDSWQKALEINPAQIYVQNNLAWSLATTPDATLRNGAKAVALATQANQSSGSGNPAILRTLAAAYAETGDCARAATTARRALELAQGRKNDGLAATLREELKLYQAGKPARDIPPKENKPTAPDAPP
ncbi:MAG: tetratricopeptide repeat protein [Verrucomicrobiota bacterium]